MHISRIKPNHQQGLAAAASVMRDVALWLEESGRKMWHSNRMTPETMAKWAASDELYLAEIDSQSAAVVTFEASDDPQALYVGKLAVM